MRENRDGKRKNEHHDAYKAQEPSAILDNESSSTTNHRTKQIKKEKRYNFQPINKIDPEQPAPTNVLKSISVSQIRNTAFSENRVKTDLPRGLNPPKSVLRRVPSSKSKTKSKPLENRVQRDSDELSEHVVWKYSPVRPNNDKKTFSSPESKDASLPNLTNPPSTPVVANKLHSILNFTHLHELDNIEDANAINKHQENAIKQELQGSSSPKDLQRNIKDILNEMRKDTDFNLNDNKLDELPSSPDSYIGNCDTPEDGNNIHDLGISLIKKEAGIIPPTTALEEDIGPAVAPTVENEERVLQPSEIKLNKQITTLKPQEVTYKRKADNEEIKETAAPTINIGSTDNRNILTSVPSKTVSSPQSDYDLDDDDDDELLEMISQNNPSQKQKQTEERQEKNINIALDFIPSSDYSDEDMLDDSLLDLFDKPKAQPTIPNNDNKNVFQYTNGPGVPDESKHQEYIRLAQSANQRPGVNRLVINSIRSLTLPNNIQQKIVTCVDNSGSPITIILRSPWVFLELTEGDVIHTVEGKQSSNKRLFTMEKDPISKVSNDNLLVAHPDMLLSATAIGNSYKCLRNGVIDNLFQDIRGEPSISMTIGNIVHELLQDALKHKCTTETLTMEYLEAKLDTLLSDFSFAIIVCNETVEDVKKKIIEVHLSNIFHFVNKFVSQDNFGKYVSDSDTRKEKPTSISDIIDIEENIWSHIYGLKGFLDVTVNARVEQSHHIVPLEVKTGKFKSDAHRVQGLIYTLLLSDKYDIPVDFFYLLYTTEEQMTSIPRLTNIMRDIMMIRNMLAISLKHRLSEIKDFKYIDFHLPPMTNTELCNKCFNKTQCMVLHKLIEDGTADSVRIPSNDFEMLTSHLTGNIQKYKEFFLKYNDLINKEESSVCHMNQQLFLMDSKTRESISGHCLGDLAVTRINPDSTREGSFIYEFHRREGSSQIYQSMIHSQISVNDLVIISDENGHFSLTSGFVTEINSNSIKVSSSRKFLNNKVISGLDNHTVVESVINPTIKEDDILSTQNAVTYRIDKNDIQQNLSSSRFNLLNIFLPPIEPGSSTLDEKTKEMHYFKPSEGGDEKMRKFMIDQIPPRFVPPNEPPLINATELKSSTLNIDQKNAIEMCIRAQDYALILGMPGTGKTTVITELVKMMVQNGKKILLTSYTHSAVDNILLKLLQTDIPTIRLGSPKKIHPDVQRYIPNYDSVQTYAQFLKIINNASLVATTCLGLKDLLFSLRERDFDYVIIDEASQVSMPVALGPLRFGTKFIMVGDHNQLPPLVKNESARVGGLEDSLFKMLSEQHPESVAELTLQYRMCGDIVKLSNFLIYDNKLKCGTDEVQNRSLHIPHMETISNYKVTPLGEDWLHDLLDPSRKVIFADYDSNSNIVEDSEGNNISNDGECDLISQTVDGLMATGIGCEQIGVMTLYRAQLRKLQKRLSGSKYRGLEVLTADQFQGRDKDCILISMVRSNSELRGGSLLREIRRVNVAMTRAKSKLIIFGSKKTIGSIGEIREFMKMLHDNGWIYELPANCTSTYRFPQEVSSQKATNRSQSSTKGAKNIQSNSKILKDKPITKQTLES